MSFGSVTIYTGDDSATGSSGGFTLVDTSLDKYATKVSLYNAESSLLGLVLTRASTVSLANSVSSLSELVELRASDLETQIDEISSGGGNTEASDDYSELTFNEGVLTAIRTWADSTKSELVKGKLFTYEEGRLAEVADFDEVNVTVLTKTLTYDSEGNLESITKDYVQ